MSKKLSFPSSDFSRELNARVNAYFTNHSPFASNKIILKAIMLFAGINLSFFSLVLGHWPSWIVVGHLLAIAFFLSAFGFNVMHEAAHGNIVSTEPIKSILRYSMDIFGVSSYLYRTKHVTAHHTFTNINRMDGDISEARIIRMSPEQTRLRIHKFQHLYSFFLYTLLIITWIWMSDIMRIFTLKVCDLKIPRPSLRQFFLFFFFKGFHFFYALYWPSTIYGWRNTFLCYLAVQLIVGIVLTTIFQMAHLFDKAKFPVLDENGKMPTDWYHHQLQTCSSFSTQNKWLTWYLGGLNFQTEHHLYPNVSYYHLPALSLIIKKCCSDYGIPYNEYPNFSAALVSHYELLKRLGNA